MIVLEFFRPGSVSESFPQPDPISGHSIRIVDPSHCGIFIDQKTATEPRLGMRAFLISLLCVLYGIICLAAKRQSSIHPESQPDYEFTAKIRTKLGQETGSSLNKKSAAEGKRANGANPNQKLVRMTMKRRDTRDFVKDFVTRAKSGGNTKPMVVQASTTTSTTTDASHENEDGKVVIKDYANSQYYGEITM